MYSSRAIASLSCSYCKIASSLVSLLRSIGSAMSMNGFGLLYGAASIFMPLAQLILGDRSSCMIALILFISIFIIIALDCCFSFISSDFYIFIFTTSILCICSNAITR